MLPDIYIHTQVHTRVIITIGLFIFNCTPPTDDNNKNSILKITTISKDLLTFQCLSVIPWTTVISGGYTVKNGMAHCYYATCTL